MIKGLYSSSNGMPPMLVRMEVIANNLANINTTGFKKDAMFVEMMNDAGAAPPVGAGELSGRLNVVRMTDFAEGSLEQTGNPLDLALQGAGYFVVQTPEGERYTRNGNFTLALDGSLVTQDGFQVLGKGGRIKFPDVQRVVRGDVAINAAGEITMDKNVIGQLRVVNFADETMLRKAGDALFRVEQGADAGLTEQDLPTVRQGFLEESNVDGMAEMIDMIEIMRHFESNQKAIASQDATLERALEVGKF
ncbi:MAG: flagellar basal-body rod protein FlgF [Ignavibacteriae bacterium]|nr:flagellar basal-body rod protein FlgF [Ignavibacteriota bacterium]